MEKKIKNQEASNSLILLNERVRHALSINAIGFTLNGIKISAPVEKKLAKMEAMGLIKIVSGSPKICYF